MESFWPVSGEVQIVGVATSNLLELYLNGSYVASGANTYSLLSVSNLFAAIGQGFGQNNPYVYGYIERSPFVLWRAIAGANCGGQLGHRPNSTNAPPGALESLSAAFPATLTLGAVTNNIAVLANYANVSGVNVSIFTTFASSNSSIISVTNGQIHRGGGGFDHALGQL